MNITDVRNKYNSWLDEEKQKYDEEKHNAEITLERRRKQFVDSHEWLFSNIETYIDNLINKKIKKSHIMVNPNDVYLHLDIQRKKGIRKLKLITPMIHVRLSYDSTLFISEYIQELYQKKGFTVKIIDRDEVNIRIGGWQDNVQ